MANPISIPILYNSDFNQNQLLNPVIHYGTRTAATNTQPNISGIEGQLCYTTDTQEFWYHDLTQWVAIGTSSGGVTAITGGLHVNVSAATGNVTINHDTSHPSTDIGIGWTATTVVKSFELSDDGTGHVQGVVELDLLDVVDNYLKWNIDSDYTSTKAPQEIESKRYISFRSIKGTSTPDGSLAITKATIGGTNTGGGLQDDLEMRIGHTSAFTGITGGTFAGGTQLIWDLTINAEGHVTAGKSATPSQIGLATLSFDTVTIDSIASIPAGTADIVAQTNGDTLTISSAPASGHTNPGIELKTDASTDTLFIAHAATTGLNAQAHSGSTGQFVSSVTTDDYGHILGFAFTSAVLTDEHLGNTNLVQTDNQRTFLIKDNQASGLKFNTMVGATPRPMLHFDTRDGIEQVFIGDGTLNPDVTIYGSLDVVGPLTYLQSNEVNIGDSIIKLNADETGAPSENGGLEVERGTSSNVFWIWNESMGYWSNVDTQMHIGLINKKSTAATQILVSDGGVVKYRTPAEIRGDIGAGTMETWNLVSVTGNSGPGSSPVGNNQNANFVDGSNIQIRYSLPSAGNPTLTFDVPNAGTSTKGAIEVATNAEVASGTAGFLAVTSGSMKALAATKTIVGNGSLAQYDIVHNWDTNDVQVQVMENDSAQNFVNVQVAISRPNTNTVRLNFGKNIDNLKSYRVMIFRLSFATDLT